MARNVLGGELECCCNDPVTGFFRNGKCDTNAEDVGMHTVCVEMTDAFLQFAKSKGNDLITPVPAYRFPGLKAGDRWCVCLGTVLQSIEEGQTPKIVLNATHVSVLEFLTRDQLTALAVDR